MIENELVIGGQDISETEEKWRNLLSNERERKWPIWNRSVELYIEFGDKVKWFIENGE